MRMRRVRTLQLLLGAVTFATLAALPQPASAQTPFVPYFGKNHVRFDNFQWFIYKTDRFEIYYYPALEKHLQRIASYADSAYQRISTKLKHDLPDRIPLILFKTQSEFQEQMIAGTELPEGVLAFAEPERNRMVLPIDEPADRLYQLIVHELTHIFEFDIIPQGLLTNDMPLWIDEGLSDFMTGSWNPLDLMAVRDAALSDSVPKMSEMRSAPMSGRAPYSLGHAVFEFIEGKWGEEGLRQYLFSLRRSAVGSQTSAYEEAFKLKADDFDDQFDKYLRERFKPFRDKERPNDYGRNLMPKPGTTPFVSVLSIEPSPSGDIIAAVVGNTRDQEIDIVLLSSKDGQVIHNLTRGFDKDRGFEYIAMAGGLRGNLVPWIAFAPDGESVGYFARAQKHKTLIIQSVTTRLITQKIDLKTVDNPESPTFSPDGKSVMFSGLQGGVTDIFSVDLATKKVTNLTNDEFADYSPAYSPDGKSIVYSAHVSGSDKLFLFDLATKKKTQISFGAHDDLGAKFYDDHTIVFTSTASDPNTPMTPDVARNANIPNIWSLDMRSMDLKQITDTATGNLSPALLRESGALKVAFVSYAKGEYGIRSVAGNKVVATVPSADFGTPGPIIDFQPPFTHTLVRENIHRKDAFEKMTFSGRPPVTVGITSGGNLYGNTAFSFTDVLGDKSITFYAQTVSTARTTALSYVNSEHRLQYAFQGFSQETYIYPDAYYASGVLYDPDYAPYISRDDAQATLAVRGGSAFGIYPFSRYTRAEVSASYVNIQQQFNEPSTQAFAQGYSFGSGNLLPLGIALVQETTVFRDFGPVAGSTVRLSYEAAPKIGKFLSRQTVEADVRHYSRIAANGVLATRLRAYKSRGDFPDYMYFGGNSEMRGYDYQGFVGHKGFFADAELRFPMIDAMLTPFGVLGGLRGTFFLNVGGAAYNNVTFRAATTKGELVAPLVGYDVNAFGGLTPVFGDPLPVRGFRLIDARASYGIGLESFLLGFPMHFDWSWKTMFNKTWEDVIFPNCVQGTVHTLDCTGGSAAFRKIKFSFWIGYDF